MVRERSLDEVKRVLIADAGRALASCEGGIRPDAAWRGPLGPRAVVFRGTWDGEEGQRVVLGSKGAAQAVSLLVMERGKEGIRELRQVFRGDGFALGITFQSMFFDRARTGSELVFEKHWFHQEYERRGRGWFGKREFLGGFVLLQSRGVALEEG